MKEQHSTLRNMLAREASLRESESRDSSPHRHRSHSGESSASSTGRQQTAVVPPVPAAGSSDSLSPTVQRVSGSPNVEAARNGPENGYYNRVFKKKFYGRQGPSGMEPSAESSSATKFLPKGKDWTKNMSEDSEQTPASSAVTLNLPTSEPPDSRPGSTNSSNKGRNRTSSSHAPSPRPPSASHSHNSASLARSSPATAPPSRPGSELSREAFLSSPFSRTQLPAPFPMMEQFRMGLAGVDYPMGAFAGHPPFGFGLPGFQNPLMDLARNSVASEMARHAFSTDPQLLNLSRHVKDSH